MKVLRTSTLAAVFLGLSMGAVADPGKPRIFQAGPVLSAADGVTEIGAAWLKRSKDRVDGRIMTTVDIAGIPYTVWWVIFNNPAGCSDPCGMDDVVTADGTWGSAADVAVFNASGAISADDGFGRAVINLDLSVIGGEGAGIGSQSTDGLPPFFHRILKKNNAQCAEIHLDINVHNVAAPVDWLTELTYPAPPGNTESFAVFKPASDC